jgi:hypothetical protein
LQTIYVTAVRNMGTTYKIHLEKPTEGLVKQPDCIWRIILKHALDKENVQVQNRDN